MAKNSYYSVYEWKDRKWKPADSFSSKRSAEMYAEDNSKSQQSKYLVEEETPMIIYDKGEKNVLYDK